MAEAQLLDLAQQRSQLARHGFDAQGAEAAIALSERCDSLCETVCGRASRDFASSLEWTTLIFRQAAAKKEGGRAKRELQKAIVCLREAAQTFATAVGETHTETARARFNLATALLATGSKLDAREAGEVHAVAMSSLWRALKRPDLAERSIADMALALAQTHLRTAAHLDDAEGQGSASHAVAALLREALAFEEAGAAGKGGPLTPCAHTAGGGTCIVWLTLPPWAIKTSTTGRWQNVHAISRGVTPSWRGG
jgi:hypothetical protein